MEKRTVQTLLAQYLHSREPIDMEALQRLIDEEPMLAKDLIMESIRCLREEDTPPQSPPSRSDPT